MTEGSYQTVITGSRTERSIEDAPVQTLVIGRREIEASGAQDLAELLDSIPGIQLDTNSQFGTGVEIQGLSSRHVLVLVDGERVTGRTGDRFDVTRLRLDNVAQVEIVKGASSALYGSEAMGGVIHLRTRRAGRPFEGNAEVRAGDQGFSGSASGATAGKDSLFRVTAGFRHDEPYRLIPDSIGTTGSGTDDTNVDLRAEHRFSEVFSVTATANYFHRELVSVDQQDGRRAVFDRQNRVDQIFVTVGPRFRFSEDSSLAFSLHGGYALDQLLQDQRGSSALDQLQRTQDVLVQGSAQFDQRISDHNLTVGVDLLHESVESPRLPDGSSGRIRPAVFAQDDWQIADWFAVTPGIRADYDSWFYSQVSPKVAARAMPLKWLTLRASYGHGFRAPDFREMLLEFENPSVGYRVQGNPDLRPEISRSTNVGATVQATDWLRFDVNFFHHDLENLILSVPLEDGGPTQTMIFGYENIGRAVSRGVETTVGLRVARQLRMDLGYTFTDARDLTHDRELDGRAPHRVTLSSTWRTEFGPTFTARGEWVSERKFFPLESGGRERIGEAYVFLNLRAQQPIVEGISLLGGVDNVFDAGNVETLPIRPRAYWAGLSFTY
jgi:outer membrane receptor for ferrienterochelin and colicins